MKKIFNVELLPDAVDFLENLDEKTREKVYYNIRKSQFVQDNELFKKLNDFIWEFRTLYNNSHTDSSHFGILPGNKIQWLLLHMEYSKRLKRRRQKK